MTEPTADDTNQPEPGDEGAVDFEQYPPDHPLVKALENNKAKLAKLHERMAPDRLKDLETKAKRLTQIEEASKTETQRLTDQLAAESARADTAEAALLRYAVAVKQGVPAQAMKFITGATEDEIEASAKDVLALIGDAGKPRPPRPDPNQGRAAAEVNDPAHQFAAFLKQQLDNA